VKKIQILGTGCAKCAKLAQNAGEAVKNLGADCEIEKVTDMKTIMGYGVMMTPALVIDGKVKTVGKVLTPAEIEVIIKG